MANRLSTQRQWALAIALVLLAGSLLPLPTHVGFANPSSSPSEKDLKDDDKGNARVYSEEYELAKIRWLTGGMLCFALLVFLLMWSLIKQKNISPEAVLRCFGTPLIVLSAVLLVIARVPKDETAPVVGLLGTIAGYLLGKTARSGNELLRRGIEAPEAPENSAEPETSR